MAVLEKDLCVLQSAPNSLALDRLPDINTPHRIWIQEPTQAAVPHLLEGAEICNVDTLKGAAPSGCPSLWVPGCSLETGWHPSLLSDWSLLTVQIHQRFYVFFFCNCFFKKCLKIKDLKWTLERGVNLWWDFVTFTAWDNAVLLETHHHIHA